MNSGSPSYVGTQLPRVRAKLAAGATDWRPALGSYLMSWMPRSLPHVWDAPQHAPRPLPCCIDDVTTAHFLHPTLGRFSKPQLPVTRQQAGAC